MIKEGRGARGDNQGNDELKSGNETIVGLRKSERARCGCQ